MKTYLRGYLLVLALPVMYAVSTYDQAIAYYNPARQTSIHASLLLAVFFSALLWLPAICLAGKRFSAALHIICGILVATLALLLTGCGSLP